MHRSHRFQRPRRLTWIRKAEPGCVAWVAVKELKLRDYPHIMENQMEKKMENEMEAGGI